jgi:hypothetical protein
MRNLCTVASPPTCWRPTCAVPSRAWWPVTSRMKASARSRSTALRDCRRARDHGADG